MATVLGSRPILNVDADPNTIPGLEIQSALESQFATDVTTGLVYKYDPDLVEGERWAVYDTRPYKVYTGIITQANTLLTLENTTGATFTYGNGNNEIVASSPVFTTNKTVVLATSSSNANGNTTVSANVFSTNIVQFKWVVTTGFGADVGDADSDTFVEIKVYP